MVHSAFESIQLELEWEWNRFNQILIVCVVFKVSKHSSSYTILYSLSLTYSSGVLQLDLRDAMRSGGVVEKKGSLVVQQKERTSL